MPLPRATYRLQLHRHFGFDAAADLAPYLARLGVSHVYTSPYLKARPGSMHGYDIVAHDQLNPELGNEAAFLRMVEAFKVHDLKQIVDFVPNHMGVGGSDNPLWLDVLEWGSESRYAGWFDIEWEPHNKYLIGKVLVPFLANQYGIELEAGKLRLQFDAERGEFAVWAYDTHKLPICPLNYAEILSAGTTDLETLGDDFSALGEWRPQVVRRADELKQQLTKLIQSNSDAAEAIMASLLSFNAHDQLNAPRPELHALIQQQNWRATHFRVAGDDINYRRFFNVNELAGLRIELPDVFEHTHQLLLQLIRRDHIDGLRIDHIDGLIDPSGYLQRLREVSREASHRSNPDHDMYLVVEKILSGNEELPGEWPVHGTTGYEFGSLTLQLLVAPSGEALLTRGYEAFIGRQQSFQQVVRDSKIRIMDNEMAAELNVLARAAARVARLTPRTADFTGGILLRAIRALITCLSVYRTYLDSKAMPSEADLTVLQAAIAAARAYDREIDPSVFTFLEKLLNGQLMEPRSGFIRHKVLRCAMRLQQYSGPVMAKGLEDTAFYRFNRFIALNEVGSDPECFGIDIDTWHRANVKRIQQWPHSMLTTSTHDSKRGEDTRARLAVLSELPEDWLSHIAKWKKLLLEAADLQDDQIDLNDVYQVLQMLVGSCPATLTLQADDDAPELLDFRERAMAATRKSLREAKTLTTWLRPDEAYEARVLAVVEIALRPQRCRAFWNSFLPFVHRLALFGMYNSLAQVTLKLTSPGVPDIYQGCEGWNFSMVDPDNRRPVNYAKHTAQLEEASANPAARNELMHCYLAHWHDGRIKLWITHVILQFRATHAALFQNGRYEPITTLGARAEEACIFLRQWHDVLAVIVVTRFPVRREHGDEESQWRNTRFSLPPAIKCRTLTDVISGRVIVNTGEIRIHDVIAGVPVAVLTATGTRAP